MLFQFYSDFPRSTTVIYNSRNLLVSADNHFPNPARFDYVDLGYSSGCRFDYVGLTDNSTSPEGAYSLARLCDFTSISLDQVIRSRTNDVDLVLSTDDYNLRPRRGFTLYYEVVLGQYGKLRMRSLHVISVVTPTDTNAALNA